MEIASSLLERNEQDLFFKLIAIRGENWILYGNEILGTMA